MTINNNGNNGHRPAVVWLNDLQRAKLEGMTGTKPKITIQDLLEKINDPNAPEQALIPSSPRSVESCFRLGVDPLELQYHPIAFYKYTGDTDEIAKLRYEKNEQVRRERVKSLIELRKRLVDDGWTGEYGRSLASAKRSPGSDSGGGGRGPSSATMVERERQRLDILKKRQERELAQIVSHEYQRKELADKQQRKVDALEARASDLARQKAEHDREWLSKQRDIELARVQADRELEREAKRGAEERYRREREIQRAKEEEERKMKKESYAREMERRQRTLDARAETERILSEQAERVRTRKQHMEALDVERARRLEAEAQGRTLANLEKRKKAEVRISSALAANHEILRKKRDEFERREREVEARRQEMERQERLSLESRRQAELAREAERQGKYYTAMELEEQRKKQLRDRAEAKERELAELAAWRRRDHDIRRVEKEFDLKRRLDRVDEIQKVQLYQRQSLLERIMDDYERTRIMMRERAALQMARKDANMQASVQRQQLMAAMEVMKASGSLERLSAAAGGVGGGGGGSGGGSGGGMEGYARRPATARV